MKRVLWLASLVAVLLGGGLLWADEPPEMQLEFVKKLRARKMAGLALEYLQLLQKHPPAGMESVLPVEIARTKVSLAQEKEPSQRAVLFGEARAELQAALVRLGQKPEEAQIRLEIARLTTFQGQALLSQALRQEDEAAAKDLATRAQQQFVAARKELDQAIGTIEKLAQTYTNPNPELEKAYKKRLAEDAMQARFDRAKSFIDEARTFLDLDAAGVRLKRATLVDEARKAMEAIAKDDEGINPAVSYLAYAWLVRINYDGQDPGKAQSYLARLMKVTSREAEPAKRWARLFQMQGAYEDPTVKPPPGMSKVQWVQKMARDWLLDYPGAKKTPEGYAVQFELAAALFKEAQTFKNQKDKKTLTQYEEARKIFAAIADSDSDLSERANQLNLQISIMRLGDDAAVEKLRDFDECFLKARVEMTKLQEVVKQLNSAPMEKKKELEGSRKKHLRVIISAFQRALQLATPKTPPTKIEEVRFYLTFSYLLAGDMYRAAVMGEHLALADPPGRRAPLAAGYAVQAYLGILSKENADVNRDRLMHLINHILETRAKDWRTEPVYPMARYQLAMLHLKEGHHQQAIAELEKLPPEFNAYLFSQCQLALTALAAARKAEKDEEKRTFEEKALNTLRKHSKLPAGADSATAQMFFAAQIEHLKLMYSDASKHLAGELPVAVKKYETMLAFGQDLAGQLKQANLDPGIRSQLDGVLETLQKYARFGLADCAYRQGDFTKVLEDRLTGKVVADVTALGKGGGKIQLEDYQITGDLLGLALRANVQKGNVSKAQQILDLIQRLTDKNDVVVDPGAVLRNLLGELQTQLKELRSKGNQEKLRATIGSFSNFLDAVMKQRGTKGLQSSEILFLANCFASLEQHAKAADLLRQIPKVPPPSEPPVPPEPLRDGASEEEMAAHKKLREAYEKKRLDYEKAKQAFETYWFAQVLLGQQTRLHAKQLRQTQNPQADQLVKEARTILESVLAEEKAVGRLIAEKEIIHLLEDQELYGTCITRWSNFMQHPQIQAQLRKGDAKAKELYFETYYHGFIYCWFKLSQVPKIKDTPIKGTAKEQQYIQKAVDNILRIENLANKDGWEIIRPRVLELLQSEPLLNEAYRKAKEKTK